jgi:hypothetical protein
MYISMDKYDNSLTHICPFLNIYFKIRDLINLGFNKVIGYVTTILFWIDRWNEDCALYCDYSRLFSIATQFNITVA